MRDMGDTTAYLRRGIREIVCLVLFFFTFLACEYLFDARMAEFVSPDEVVIYESLVIGASVIGFLGQAGVSGRARRAAALGDDFEYRDGFEHQHRVLLVEGS